MNLFYLDLHEHTLGSKYNIVTHKTFMSASNTIPSPTSDDEHKELPSKDVRKGWYDIAIKHVIIILESQTPIPCTQVWLRVLSTV